MIKLNTSRGEILYLSTRASFTLTSGQLPNHTEIHQGYSAYSVRFSIEELSREIENQLRDQEIDRAVLALAQLIEPGDDPTRLRALAMRLMGYSS